MKVIIDKNAGPCSGVKNAIRKTEKLLEKSSDVVSLGPIIHNTRELDRLRSLGLDVVDQDAVEQNSETAVLTGKNVFIRSHGISPKLRELLTENHIDFTDGTCGKVRRLQKLIAEYHEQGYQVVITGKKDHPEVRGLMGHCDDKGIVIRDARSFDGIDPDRKTLLVSQTTFERRQFKEIRDALLLFVKSVEVMDTTCKSIRRKNEEMEEFAKTVDVLIMVGGKHSSNTGVLFDQCKRSNGRSYRVEGPDDIDPTWFKHKDKVGITGSASTPRWQLKQVAKRLNSLKKGF